MGTPTTARQRARAEITREILDEAARQLAQQGAAALSLRAVARALGMASSAVYRYFPSRDQLLTTLIIEAYDDLGEHAEAADAGAAEGGGTARWLAVGRAVRSWALTNPHRYALLYGSPVPGYQAPRDTVDPASRTTRVLARIVVDAAAGGQLQPPESPPPPGAAWAVVAEEVAARGLPGLGPEGVLRALMAWTQLFGMVSFELFGHLVGVVGDNEVFFESALVRIGSFVGLPFA